MEEVSQFVVDFIHDMIDIKSIHFGDYTLGNQEKTSVYFDLRLIPSYPRIFAKAIDLICAKIIEQGLNHDIICGVPFAAISFASCVSMETNCGLILKRTQIKKYGTQKLIEGFYRPGMRCLIVEDVVVHGSSIQDVVEGLRDNGILVTDAVTILDRQQGGRENLWGKCQVRLHSVLNCDDVLAALRKETKWGEMAVLLRDFIDSNCKRNFLEGKNCQKLKNGDKINKLGAKMREIAREKKSNIILALDFDNSTQIFDMIQKCCERICAVKLHSDIISDFDPNFAAKLRQMSQIHNFLIIEDRKFCDVGDVVQNQYNSGTFSVVHWADIVTVHGILGDETLKSLKKRLHGIPEDRGCLLITEMSSASSFRSAAYRTHVVKMAERHGDFVCGFICQERVKNDFFISVTPGIRLEGGNDSLDQLYRCPQRSGRDFYVVGRGITEAEDPAVEVVRYAERLYGGE